MHSRDVRTDQNASVNAHRHVQGHVHIHTLLHIRPCVCVFVDASANACLHVREHVYERIFSVRGGRECYLVLSCGHL